jgi:hypothetical protein
MSVVHIDGYAPVCNHRGCQLQNYDRYQVQTYSMTNRSLQSEKEAVTHRPFTISDGMPWDRQMQQQSISGPEGPQRRCHEAS